jgi:zinc transporter, ZIP family
MITFHEVSIIFQEASWTLLMTLFVASSFIFGSILSINIKYPKRLKGDLASFSAGIFFSTVSFILVDESIEIGSFSTMAIGFVAGAVIFSFAHKFLKKQLPKVSESFKAIDNENNKVENIQTDSRHIEKYTKSKRIKKIKTIFIKKTYKKKNDTKNLPVNSANTLVIGKLMDSIPKALFIGVIVALDIVGLLAAVISLFLGNLTATMEGARRMREEGKSAKVILKRWSIIAIAVAISGPLGYYLARPLSNEQLSILIGFAAGDLIAFIVEDLIPEAYKKVEWHTGLSAAFGFLTGLTMFHFL